MVGHGARHLLVVSPTYRYYSSPDRQCTRAGCQHCRRVVNAGLAIPAVIILGCALLAGIVAMATRKKRAPWDILPGPVPSQDSDAAPIGPDLFDGGDEYADLAEDVEGTDEEEEVPSPELAASASLPSANLEGLAEWHRRNEQTVSGWIENHQRVLGEINASGLQIDMGQRDDLMAGHDEMAPKMREAIASHPSPVMRAELSAMHVAGEAAVFAVIRSDYETARRQHLIYVQYRDEWIERLRQFSEGSMSNLRAVMNTDEFELEEIRAALETALFETEEQEEHEPDFEAPLIVREDPTTVLDLGDQSPEALEVAVGTPEDTTDTLEGGRIRRLVRRVGSPKAPPDEVQ